MAKANEAIVEGITLDKSGTVHIESDLEQTLCDVAIELQSDDRPVDVRHVVAALVMATRDGKIDRATRLGDLTDEQSRVLSRYVGVLFQQHGGSISDD